MEMVPFRKKILSICVKSSSRRLLLSAQQQAKMDYDNMVNSFIKQWTTHLKKL